MPVPRSAPEAPLAACSLRLLGVHLEASEPATSDAVAAAVERLADALLRWHDALVAADPDHRTCARSAPTRTPMGSPLSPRAVSTATLERLSISAQVAGRELDHVADAVTEHAVGIDERAEGQLTADTTRRLADRGRDIAGSLHDLAEVVAELGDAAARARQAPDPGRTATVVARAEQVVRRAADSAARHAS